MKHKKNFCQLQGIRLLFGILFMSVIILAGTHTVSAATKDFNKNPTIIISDSGSNFDLNNRKWKKNRYTWIKYKAKKNGYITITADWCSNYDRSSGFWRLYAKNKKTALSKRIGYEIIYGAKTSKYEKQSIYGVKKGNVYYLRLEAINGVKLTCKFKEVKEKSYSKIKKKMSLLKKNKKVTGTILPNDKKKDWYKIQFKKPQYVNLYFDAKTDGMFKITFCSVIGSKLASGKFKYTESAVKILVRQKNSLNKKKVKYTKLNPGIYYIKIEPVDKYSSGYYTLKWK